jgi:hypothetical protein
VFVVGTASVVCCVGLLIFCCGHHGSLGLALQSTGGGVAVLFNGELVLNLDLIDMCYCLFLDHILELVFVN